MPLCQVFGQTSTWICGSYLNAIAILLALGIVWWQVRGNMQYIETLLGMIPFVFAGAALTGRLIFIIFLPQEVAAYFSPEWFLDHLLDLQNGPLTVWRGGMDPGGLLLGGILGGLVYLGMLKKLWVLWGSMLILPLTVALGIASIVNLPELAATALVVWCIAGVTVLLIQERMWLVHFQNPSRLFSGGAIMALGLVISELLRDESRLPRQVSFLQIVSGIILVLCVLGVIRSRRNRISQEIQT